MRPRLAGLRMSPEQAAAEALELVARLNALLDALVVRGLRTAGPEERARLASHRDHLAGIGAGHLAAALAELLAALEDGRREAARALLAARASVRVFERLLTLRVVSAQWQAAAAAEDA